MKKCILFVFWVMLFLLLGPQPLQVGNTRKETNLTIKEKDDDLEPVKMAINQIQEYAVEEVAVVFAEHVCERNKAVPPVNYRNVIVKPKFRVQSARQNIEDGNQIFA